MYIRANLISSCRLFPVSGGKGSVIPWVHTELGGDWWVEREVSASELLAMWDVPEPLVMTLSSDKERRSLLKSCEVPHKVMEHVVDSLHSMWSCDAETPVRKRSVNPATKAAASSVITRKIERSHLAPTDKDTHPEVSKESAENPEVSLAERALQEVLNQVNLEELAGSDRDAKAAKDDKAKAPTYMWDRWPLPYCNVLSQQRGEPAQHLDWRRSFSLLRFWK
jgi:hypothetical protein